LPAESYFGVSCEAIINSSFSEIDLLSDKIREASEEDIETFSEVLSDSNLSNWISKEDCSSFLKKRKYISSPLSQREAEFPIAYAIVAYEKAGEVEVGSLQFYFEFVL
jgi:hypothetical protein